LEGGAPDGAAQDDAPPGDARAHIAELLAIGQKEVSERRQRLEAKLANLQTLHAEASAATEKHNKAVAEQEKEVEQDEAKVVTARVRLSAAYVDMGEKLKERNATAKLCSELSGPTIVAELLSQVEASPEKYEAQGGRLGEYSRLHQEWRALQEQHSQAKASISAVETVANCSRVELERLRAKQAATQDMASRLGAEIKAVQDSLVKLSDEEVSLQTRMEQRLGSFDAAFGPRGSLPTAVASLPPSNLTLLSVLDDIFTARFQALEKRMLRMFVQAGKPAAAQVLKQGLLSVADLVDSGYTAKDMLDGGCTIADVLQAHPAVDVARCFCKPLPEAPPRSKADVVTHIFTGIQAIRSLGGHEEAWLVSPELSFSDVAVQAWRYSFKLWLDPRGRFSLLFDLRPGTDPSALPWPMKKEEFIIRLRVLARSRTTRQHEEQEIDGLFDMDVGGKYFEEQVPPLFSREPLGFHRFLTEEGAFSGAYFLGPDKDCVAVQCQLCLR